MISGGLGFIGIEDVTAIAVADEDGGDLRPLCAYAERSLLELAGCF
ncbi:hypothetical protein [Zestomonas thermotolerans]|nr:hypothetical protein [Pseudomonas thermotolerans]